MKLWDYIKSQSHIHFQFWGIFECSLYKWFGLYPKLLLKVSMLRHRLGGWPFYIKYCAYGRLYQDSTVFSFQSSIIYLIVYNRGADGPAGLTFLSGK